MCGQKSNLPTQPCGLHPADVLIGSPQRVVEASRARMETSVKVDGQGDPNTSSEYFEAISALYQVAYKIKFASKQQLERRQKG